MYFIYCLNSYEPPPAVSSMIFLAARRDQHILFCPILLLFPPPFRNEESESKTAVHQNEDTTSEMNDTEKRVWQMFEQHGGGSHGSSCWPTQDPNLAADYSTEMFMTLVDKTYRSDSTIVQPRTPPSSSMPPDDDDDDEDDYFSQDDGGPGEATGRGVTTIEKRSSVHGFRTAKNDGSPGNDNINSDDNDNDDDDGDDVDSNHPKAVSIR